MFRTLLCLLFGLLIGQFSALAQLTIAEIQGTGEDSPYKDQVVSTSGIVTAVHSQGYFIQDSEAVRSGIYVYDQSQSPAVGDRINLTGTVAEFYNLTELKDLTAFEVTSSGNPLPSPITLTTGGIHDEDYEGMLVSITGICTDTNLGHGEWELNDGSGPAAIDDLIFAFTPLLNTEYKVTGPLTYTFSAYKVEPRSADDIQIQIPLYFTKSPVEKDIQTTSLTISWTTNVAASTEVAYGLTPSLELGTLNVPGDVVDHEITLPNLMPATPYYIKAMSILGNDSAPSIIQVMSTASNSSGDIKVYFNHSVDHSVATNELAVSTPHIIDTIIGYIDRAQQTLDITMYEVENEAIVAAINNAQQRGVSVRYISDDEGNNSVLDQLNAAIPLVKGNNQGIMHDKFILIDREDIDNSWVMTGSMNHTEANLGWDYNNVICIQDQALARAFTLEFNEMWGGSGASPDTLNGKFGEQKSDNTPHRFVIGNRPVELYFSPSDGTANRIKAAIDAAQHEVAFAVLVFTENSLGDAIKAAHDRGLDVKGIIDYVEFNGSEYEYLLNNGINVMDYQNADGSQWPDGPTLHHKYAIIDYQSGDSPLLITGSHNWSASANSIHDENTLLIYDATLANIYFQEFNARFNNFPDGIREIPSLPLSLWPNPVNELLHIEVPEPGILRLSDFSGQVILERESQNKQVDLDLSELPAGLYHLQIGKYVGKVVKL